MNKLVASLITIALVSFNASCLDTPENADMHHASTTSLMKSSSVASLGHHHSTVSLGLAKSISSAVLETLTKLELSVPGNKENKYIAAVDKSIENAVQFVGENDAELQRACSSCLGETVSVFEGVQHLVSRIIGFFSSAKGGTAQA